MNLQAPTPLLGGISPEHFMREYWQRKPLLIRGAFPGVKPPLTPEEMLACASKARYESRLIQYRANTAIPLEAGEPQWSLTKGPIPARNLPHRSQQGWTLLLQGVNHHVAQAQTLMDAFSFIPHARMDDVMLSFATEGGGVGPHFDSYDVFLLQVSGLRLWKTGPLNEARLKPGLPLKILENFSQDEEWVLEPSDMLYLPPGWGHEGVAVQGECMTCSIGFRAPSRAEMPAGLLPILMEALEAGSALQKSSSPEGGCSGELAWAHGLYSDSGQPATSEPGRIPAAMQAFARQSLQQWLAQPVLLEEALGGYLTQLGPEAYEVFRPKDLKPACPVLAHPLTRMLYDDHAFYINGEACHPQNADRPLFQALADQRKLAWPEVQALSEEAQSLLDEWACEGWLVSGPASSRKTR
jgi:50S ribosomal protein L16 3-hydroxylase